MLSGARASQIYDALHEAELVDFLSNHRNCYDVIASAATLIHFGELQSVFAAAVRALRSHGLFVFTVFPNQSDPEAVGVAPLGGFAEGGCFVHGSGYVRRVARETGFCVALLETAAHEIDPRGTPVTGLVVALRRGANAVARE
jgi:predicted TPR repeat methyltransferase